MSLTPHPPQPIPREIAAWGERHLPMHDPYRLVGDTLFMQYDDTEFADCYHVEGRPGLSPVLLSFVTVFQAQENLSDRKTAEMVRTNLKWKYALHLPLDDDGFDASVLCEFRQRLIQHRAEGRIFDRILSYLKTAGLLTMRGIQRTDSLALLSRARDLGRLELAFETLRCALRDLQQSAADWLLPRVPTAWGERYRHHCRFERWNAEERTLLLADIGDDGQWLLDCVTAADAPAGLAERPMLDLLRTVWTQQFVAVDGKLQFNPLNVVPGRERIETPYDPEARWSKKARRSWMGYKLQVTETDDPDQPHLITDIAVTDATLADQPALQAIAERQAARATVPGQRYVDSGYMGGPMLVAADARDEDLIGPAPKDQSPQALMPDGFTQADFQIDMEQRTAICPAGHPGTAKDFVGDRDTGDRGVVFTFQKRHCRGCPLRARCVTGTRQRFLTVREHHARLVQARERAQTADFKQAYQRHRPPIEGCLSALVRGHGIRMCRYAGRQKNYVRALSIGVAVNLARAAAWLAGIRHRPKRLGLVLAVIASG